MLNKDKRMNKKYALSIFIFRRDLRLQDNTALNSALSQSKSVIPCFVFDPRQIDDVNKYKTNNAIQFMCESLSDLDEELHKRNSKLYLFYGTPEDIIKKLLASKKIDALFINRDYTPFSIKRDNALAKICTQHNIAFEQSGDALLHEPEDVLKKDGSHYSIFTAFYKKAVTVAIKEPEKLHAGHFFSEKLQYTEPKSILQKMVSHKNKDLACHGGIKEALKIVNDLEQLRNYKHDHDYPSIDTSHLSAHLKFGTISARQAYTAIIKQLGRSHPIIRQLYWRDFFTLIAYHVPTVFGHAYHKKYDKLEWNNDKKLFKLWCTARTGFPIVDAGMAELNTTGFMHNRVRMIVASFLIKDLHINWLWGEKYFAQQLVDYDPAVNNGNWQWAAGCGCDAAPYFRMFNPTLQAKRYDPKFLYIKKWITDFASYRIQPVVDHEFARKRALSVYRRALKDKETRSL